MSAELPTLEILHFNDVYHVDESTKGPIVGGAARFYTLLQRLKTSNSLILFSGDAFNPSIDSSVTKGSHMCPVLNKIGVNVACLGNHDFDFGMPILKKLLSQTNFPWLLSNVYEPGTTIPLVGAKEYHILEKNGLKIGFIGLVEQDWLDTLPSVPSDVVYVDFMTKGRELATMLKSQQNCDLVIALTHSRLPNDELLCQGVPEIDLVLGGHDHNTAIIKNGSLIRGVKSGTDFRNLSHIKLFMSDKSLTNITVNQYETTTDIEPDEEMRNLVTTLTADIKSSLSRFIAHAITPLDARSTHCRTQEVALGNLAAGLMRQFYKTDLGLITGGTIRSDTLYQGNISIRDLLEIFPFDDPCVVVKYRGEKIRNAFENAVSKYPAMDGRFCHVSGCKIKFSPLKEPGHRLVSVIIDNGEPLQDDKYYTVALRGFMADGFDGYDALKDGERLVDIEEGILLSSLFRKYFTGLRVVNRLIELSDSTTVKAHRGLRHAADKFLHLVGRKLDIDHISIQQIVAAHDGLENFGAEVLEFDEEDEYPIEYAGGRYPRLNLFGPNTEEIPVIAPLVEGRVLAVDDHDEPIPPPFTD